MILNDLKALLLTIGPPVFHYYASEQKGNYIVWAEDGSVGEFEADDKIQEQIIQGTIDYFTKVEFDPVFDQIQEKLNQAEWISWRLNSIQYEKDTKYTHYEWVFEVVNNIGGNDD